MSPRADLTSLLETTLVRSEFPTREFYPFRLTDSVLLDSEGFRAEYERALADAHADCRMLLPSDYVRPTRHIDRFPEEHFNQLVALVEQLLGAYTDPDNRFVAVLPAPQVYRDNLETSVERFSKSMVRCAALFGVPETVDTVLRLVEGEAAKYAQVVVVDGVIPSPKTEGIELWPGARLIEWDHAFGDRRELTLAIPDAVLTQTSHAGTHRFRFGRLNTLLCIDRTGGPIIRRSEDAEPRPSGSYVLTNPHQFSTEIAISALALALGHPIVEICSWHWFDTKVQALVGYRNELGPNQHMGGPPLRTGRVVGTEEAILVRNIHDRLSQPGVFEKLRVPIQRWRRSKAADNGVDLAIDLRIALESLFLDKSEISELSFRLALRAAWYLRFEGQERTDIFDALREAYKIGSKAVHTGTGYDDVIPGKLVAAQEICRRAILQRLSEGGDPPNWKSVVLGG